MKAFEEWWAKQPDIRTFELVHFYIAKDSWRAALEWTLKHQTDIGYSIPAVPVDIIQKELEE